MPKYGSRAAWLTVTGAAVATAGLPVHLVAQTLIKVRVGIGLVENHAEGYYAQEQGYFRRNGLDVELHQLQLGAVVAEGVASGNLDTGHSNIYSLLAGHQHGIPFVMIAPATLFDSTDPSHDLLVVAHDSPIGSVKELNGQTIGIFSIGGEQQMFVSNFADKNGGDSSTLKFLPIPPGAMAAALAQGRVVAVDLADPQLSAHRDEVRSLGDTFAAIAPRFIEGAWFTTTDWLAKNKDTARRFADAVVAAGRWSMANPEAAAVILQKYLNVKEPRAQVRFGTVLDPALIQPMCDTAARYKLLAPIKASEVIWNGK